ARGLPFPAAPFRLCKDLGPRAGEAVGVVGRDEEVPQRFSGDARVAPDRGYHGPNSRAHGLEQADRRALDAGCKGEDRERGEERLRVAAPAEEVDGTGEAVVRNASLEVRALG